ncbi:MAG: D-ribose pyranase [Trueperaceae bacterium]|jgi:D-ribose pyranase|nr:D-ribose pyranase [Truepera sp.]HRQ10420.1 D-ribose pyranase [Trueperaceae bacterium]
MKSGGILHAELSGIVAGMGHGDTLVIADAGLPVPPGVRCIDLALRMGVPGFQEAVETVLSELVVERGVANAEQPAAAPAAAAALEAAWPPEVPLERVSHAELKQLSAAARAVVRTGEATPYCNIVLVAGVPF